WMDGLIHIAALAWLVKVALVVIPPILIIAGREMVALLLAKPDWRAGDYDRAMRWIRRVSFGRPSNELMRIEGFTHGLANRPGEAERCFRTARASSHASLLCDRVSLLDLLGDALKDQGRYEEAGKCLQASIEMGDNNLGSARFD